jgi:hypothetical protein
MSNARTSAYAVGAIRFNVPEERIMLTVKPGQIWQRKSIEGAPWREMEVVNVGAEVELRFLDMPNAPDVKSVISTTVGRMLAGSKGGPCKYRLVRE